MSITVGPLDFPAVANVLRRKKCAQNDPPARASSDVGKPITDGLPPKASSDVDKPERLDKILAALHHLFVSESTINDNSAEFVFHHFIVDCRDHHHITRDSPKLKALGKLIGQQLFFSFNSNTGYLRIIAQDSLSVRTLLFRHIFYSFDKSLNQFRVHGHVPENDEVDLLIGFGPDDCTVPTLAFIVADSKNTATNLMTLSDVRTVVSVGLRGLAKEDFGEDRMRRIGEKSFVTVHVLETFMDGKTRIHRVQDEKLSTPDGKIKHYLSDIVKDPTRLPQNLVRNFNDATHPNIEIPYSEILAEIRLFSIARNQLRREPPDGRATAATTSTATPINRHPGRGKRSFSTFSRPNRVSTIKFLFLPTMPRVQPAGPAQRLGRLAGVWAARLFRK
ncbi:hypothetical protein MFIFM68171_07928 [Madurella fahalii]|uniref:Uncharacterized protein n=1 Tax=Madurella fahalii TaxID=1157608 RepID=A0ABQ0GIY5_9PEZI